jgi:hypothetical protein
MDGQARRLFIGDRLIEELWALGDYFGHAAHTILLSAGRSMLGEGTKWMQPSGCTGVGVSLVVTPSKE